MSTFMLNIPVGPQGVRVFCGYRLPSLTRDAFLKELGTTFMPGTPFMLAPLGLSAYVAAVLDFDTEAELPDEVALIVYASRDAYQDARQNSLQGRMYTHSHAGVFDMQKSRGQFPGPLSAPDRPESMNRWSWYLFEHAIDWQHGATRLLFLQGTSAATDLREEFLRRSRESKGALERAGIDQAIFAVAPDFGALWLHSREPLSADAQTLGLLAPQCKVARDLIAKPVPLRTGTEGIVISEPSAFSFRFVRDLGFFL